MQKQVVLITGHLVALKKVVTYRAIEKPVYLEYKHGKTVYVLRDYWVGLRYPINFQLADLKKVRMKSPARRTCNKEYYY